MKTRFTLLLLALVLAIPTQAQVDYDMVSDSTAIKDDGAQSAIEIDCMTAIDFGQPLGGNEHPDFIFYNEATGDVVYHDPEGPVGDRTVVIASDADLDLALGGDVTDCRAITTAGFTIYAALSAIVDGAQGGDVDFVFEIQLPIALGGDGVGGLINVLALADGISGIAVPELTNAGGFPPIFLSMVEFFGADEDGFYVLSEPEAGAPNGGFPLEAFPICTDPGLDLFDLSLFDGFLTASSSEFGDSKAGLQNVVVQTELDNANGGSCINVIYDPFDDGTFTNGTDGGIEDIEVPNLGGGGGGTPLQGGVGVYLLNNSFGAPDGEQWAVTFDGITGIRFAEQTPMIADPDITIPGYTPAEAPHMTVLDDGTVYVASRDAFGGADAIIVFYGAPVPVELVSFNAVVDGDNVTLNWETASETNNAGFEVQMQRGEEWNVLSFVEGHGTTTEAQTYSFSTDLLPGTYSFRLKQVDFDGQFEYFGGVEATVGTPSTHLLSAVYPNPFNPQATFDLAVAQTQNVSVELYNLLGQRVATLFNARMEADATQTFTIEGADLATGQYVVRVTGERFAESRRVTLLK